MKNNTMTGNSDKFRSSNYYRYFILAVFVILLTMSITTPVSASTGAALNVDIVRYEPYPAQIGQYVDVWVKVENNGYGRADDASIELVPSYPFSLDSNGNAIKNIGILSPDSASVKEYRLFVDNDAKHGTGTIEIRYQDNEGISWSEESFDIKVGSDTFDSKGTLQLEDITTEPEVLMPGDSGTVTLTLKNSATLNTITLDGEDYDTNAHVQAATLSGVDDITVPDDSYQGTGVLGPGDSLTLTFNVEVSDNAKDGTYLMDFSVIGNSHSYNSKWEIPVKVDSAELMVIPSKSLALQNGKGTIEFDVANMHPNTLSSVSIRPQADGVEFSPAEYFIGSMNSDELFTIEFEAETVTDDLSTPRDLILTTHYRNGQNLHETIAGELSLRLETEVEDEGNGLLIGGVLIIVLLVAGIVVYKRKKQQT